MARLAVDDGVRTIVVTPHQLGNYRHNRGPQILNLVRDVQQMLQAAQIPLQLLPGADVRIEADLISQIKRGDVLTLANRQRHLLLELPHELYFPLDQLLKNLAAAGLVGILSHPERNQGLLRDPKLAHRLVQAGCLMQLTAGSLQGNFGPASQRMAEWMLQEGLVHFVATDAHGAKSRRPLLARAFARVAELTDLPTACDLCQLFPQAVVDGHDIVPGRRKSRVRRHWLGWSKAG